MSAELPPGVGTVGEELSKLLAALSARQGSAAEADGPAEAGDPAERAQPEDGDDRLRREAPPAQSPGAQIDCTCGCHTAEVPMGQAQVCALCPLCHGIATLRSLNPALLDRLAQLAALAADTLRELAAEVTSARAAPHAPAPRPRPARSERVDIDVVDEPSGDARGGGEAQG